MKRLTVVLLAVALCSMAAIGFAAQQHASHSTVHADHSTMGGAMGAGKAVTWKGEVLDAGCYLGHGAMGAKHKECALKCASNGMPIMLMVDGKAYLLTPNHDNADPYEALKKMAGSVAEVTGTLSTRGGVSGIDVTGAKLAAAN